MSGKLLVAASRFTAPSYIYIYIFFYVSLFHYNIVLQSTLQSNVHLHAGYAKLLYSFTHNFNKIILTKYKLFHLVNNSTTMSNVNWLLHLITGVSVLSKPEPPSLEVCCPHRASAYCGVPDGPVPCCLIE